MPDSSVINETVIIFILVNIVPMRDNVHRYKHEQKLQSSKILNFKNSKLKTCKMSTKTNGPLSEKTRLQGLRKTKRQIRLPMHTVRSAPLL